MLWNHPLRFTAAIRSISIRVLGVEESLALVLPAHSFGMGDELLALVFGYSVFSPLLEQCAAVAVYHGFGGERVFACLGVGSLTEGKMEMPWMASWNT